MKSNKKERKSGFVRVRGGFSDTSGIAPRNKTIQLDEFDDDADLYYDDVFKEEEDVDEPYDDVEEEDGYGSYRDRFQDEE